MSCVCSLLVDGEHGTLSILAWWQRSTSIHAQPTLKIRRKKRLARLSILIERRVHKHHHQWPLAPKQWSLSKDESVRSFEAWKENLTYALSLNQNFVPLLGTTWLKETNGAPLHGFADDAVTVPEIRRKTA